MNEDKDALRVEEGAAGEDAHDDLELNEEDAEKVSGGNPPFEIKDWGF